MTRLNLVRQTLQITTPNNPKATFNAIITADMINTSHFQTCHGIKIYTTIPFHFTLNFGLKH